MLTDLKFIKAPEDVENLSDIDCAFFALPHGQAMDIAPQLPAQVKVIDLSGDFRLSDANVFRATLWPRTHRDGCAVAVCLRPDGNKSRSDQIGNAHRQSRVALRPRRCSDSRRWSRTIF